MHMQLFVLFIVFKYLSADDAVAVDLDSGIDCRVKKRPDIKMKRRQSQPLVRTPTAHPHRLVPDDEGHRRASSMYVCTLLLSVPTVRL